jgi:hypothetical protein
MSVTAPKQQAVRPFQFYTSLILQESAGVRAATLPGLLKALRAVPDACIYHHTHHFVFQHQYLTPSPTNDFAYWTREVLREVELGERLAAIDTMDYFNLATLRQALVEAIEGYLKQSAAAHLRFAAEGEEFFFVKSVRVVMPTPLVAGSLEEFAELLGRISLRSLYYHIFDARLRLGGPTNDFARWVGEQFGLEGLAASLARLDPYAYTLEDVRQIMGRLLRRHIGQAGS